jgi:Zn-dependent protease
MNISQLILSAMAALVALTLHEFAHGYVAYRLGDHTAKSMGRLSLNPMKHLDPFGVACMVLFHFGWAKPVPINPRNFKNPRKGFAITAIAGPATNIVLGFLAALIYLVAFKFARQTNVAFLNNLQINMLTFLNYFFIINIGLGVFNLIPVPPFDGSRVLNILLPKKWYFKVMKYERQIYWGVIAWLFFGDVVSSMLLRVPLIANIPVLSAIAKLFSLSDILSGAVSAIANGMLSFWSFVLKLG